MTEEPTPYDITPNQPETPNLKFCPFTSAATPGPLGKITFLRPPCDPEHCALGIDTQAQGKHCAINILTRELGGIAHSLSKNP